MSRIARIAVLLMFVLAIGPLAVWAGKGGSKGGGKGGGNNEIGPPVYAYVNLFRKNRRPDEWSIVILDDSGNSATLTTGLEPASTIDWSSDGELIGGYTKRTGPAPEEVSLMETSLDGGAEQTIVSYSQVEAAFTAGAGWIAYNDGTQRFYRRTTLAVANMAWNGDEEGEFAGATYGMSQDEVIFSARVFYENEDQADGSWWVSSRYQMFLLDRTLGVIEDLTDKQLPEPLLWNDWFPRYAARVDAPQLAAVLFKSVPLGGNPVAWVGKSAYGGELWRVDLATRDFIRVSNPDFGLDEGFPWFAPAYNSSTVVGAGGYFQYDNVPPGGITWADIEPENFNGGGPFAWSGDDSLVLFTKKVDNVKRILTVRDLTTTTDTDIHSLSSRDRIEWTAVNPAWSPNP